MSGFEEPNHAEQENIELKRRIRELKHECDHWRSRYQTAQRRLDNYRELLIDTHDALHRAQLLRERIEITILPDDARRAR